MPQLPLHDLHIELGGRMVEFAGYPLPLQYRLGIVQEHRWTRESAGLFDVSHMGQAIIKGPDHESSAQALHACIPSDLRSLTPGKMRYGVLLNPQGGILDDMIISRPFAEDGHLYLVVNAARKHGDFEEIQAELPANVRLEIMSDHALIALQGPDAEAVLRQHCSACADMVFMETVTAKVGDVDCIISRAGYTGEDGFEISMPAQACEEICRVLLDDERVAPIGLGARDSLRMEAGLCLYGQDLDESKSPFEADIGFTVNPKRLAQGQLRGAARLQGEKSGQLGQIRVGLALDGRLAARGGAPILNMAGDRIGEVTSGGFAPSLGHAIAIGYVDPAQIKQGDQVQLEVRSKLLPARLSPLPFVPHQYRRKNPGKTDFRLN